MRKKAFPIIGAAVLLAIAITATNGCGGGYGGGGNTGGVYATPSPMHSKM